jgi:MFS family permease
MGWLCHIDLRRGWATGGLIFGALGDRVGRARMLTICVLIYSLCTGLSAFSQGWIDFAIYRFMTGLGVGGVFGLAVASSPTACPSSRAPARWAHCKRSPQSAMSLPG